MKYPATAVQQSSVIRIRILLLSENPTAEPLFGDVPDANIDKALRIAKNRIEWKNLRPSKRC